MLKKWKSNIVAIIFSYLEHRQMKRIKSLRSIERLYVIDIDNTLTRNRLGDPINHHNPTPNTKMITYVRDCISRGDKVIFLSARHFRLLSSSLNWLKEQKVISDRNDLFLVERASDKIEYLEKLISQGNSITYVDDLSFNHENGTVKYYDEVISRVSQMELTYKGVEFISKIGR